MRIVRRKVEEDVDSADDKLATISQIIDYIGQDGSGQDDADVKKAKEDLENMQQEFNKLMEQQKQQIAEATAKLEVNLARKRYVQLVVIY